MLGFDLPVLAGNAGQLQSSHVAEHGQKLRFRTIGASTQDVFDDDVPRLTEGIVPARIFTLQPITLARRDACDGIPPLRRAIEIDADLLSR